MAPRKPRSYVPSVNEEELSTALQSAQPSWSAQELAIATDKLAKIGIDSIPELAHALAEDLNARIQKAGLKRFGADTIQELKQVISSQHNALFRRIELKEIKTQKQHLVENKLFEEAARLRDREKALIHEMEGVYCSDLSASDQKQTLKEELAKVQAFKKAGIKAEDYSGAARAREREQEILRKLDGFSEPQERARRQRVALKTERKHVLSQVQAAIQAEEYQAAHDAQERAAKLTELLSALRTQRPTREGKESSSEGQLEAEQAGNHEAILEDSARMRGGRAEDTDRSPQRNHRDAATEAAQIPSPQHQDRAAEVEPCNPMDTQKSTITGPDVDSTGMDAIVQALECELASGNGELSLAAKDDDDHPTQAHAEAPTKDDNDTPTKAHTDPPTKDDNDPPTKIYADPPTKDDNDPPAVDKHAHENLVVGEDGSLPLTDEEGNAAAQQIRWEIVSDCGTKGGIPVREGRDRQSPCYPKRLSNCAIVEEIELDGDRLHYRIVTGSGPEQGWIAVKAGGKVLARRVTGTPEDGLGADHAGLDASPQSSQASSGTHGKRVGRTAWNQFSKAERATDHGPAAGALFGATPVPQAAAADSRPEPAARRQPVVRRAEDLDPGLRSRAKELGIDIGELEDLNRVEELVNEVEKLRKLPGSKLATKCQEKGIAADECLSREELLPVATDACLWQELNAQALCKQCRVLQLIREEDQADQDLQREELLQLLQFSTWEGIPASRIPELEQRTRLQQQLRDLEACGGAEALVARSVQEGLPALPASAVAQMRANLRRAFIWNEMSLPELRRDCTARHVDQEVADAPSEDAMRRELLTRLKKNLGSEDRWRLRGIPVTALGRDRAQQVLEELDRLQDLNLPSLKLEYRKVFMKSTPGASVEDLVDELRDWAVLRHLPQEEFEQECVKYDVSYVGPRDGITRRLVEQKGIARKWEAQGVPPEVFQDSEQAEQLYKQLKLIDDMTDEQIERWYFEDNAFPRESRIPRSEMRELCKFVMTHDYLSLEDLKNMCAKEGLATEAHSREGSGEEQMTGLSNMLVENDRIKHWEKRGYQAKRIADYEKVAQLVHQCEQWRGMDEAELRDQCNKVGIAHDVGTTKDEWLQGLQRQLTLELLPMDELLEECLDNGLSIETNRFKGSESEQRLEWIKELDLVMKKKSLEQMGFSVSRLDSEKVFQVCSQNDVIAAMDIDELRGLRAEMMPHLFDDIPHEVLVRELQEWALLLALSLPELVVECQALGMPTQGYALSSADSAATSSSPKADAAADASPESDLRVSLQCRIFLRKRFIAEEQTKALTDTSLPASGSTSLSGQVRAQVWNKIRYMRDPFVAELVCNVPRQDLPLDIRLPADARSWSPLDAALYTLTESNYIPLGPPKEDGQLISVICPTNEKRRMWHPLLYGCFQQQTYEPKELVIVDTGGSPSTFFKEVAQTDKRVVYRFFAVDDANGTQDASAASRTTSSKPRSCWSLGLKRNIACSLARGSIIAQFDDDDFYFPGYLGWFQQKLVKAAGEDSGGLRPALAKLSEWHLLDLSGMEFHHMNPLSRNCIPLREQPAALYGWGFSYVFTRKAWERAPFPDVYFAEDIGFVEGLLASGTQVSLLPLPEDQTLVAHTVHPQSTTRGEVSMGLRGCNNPISPPAEFRDEYQRHANQLQKKLKGRGIFSPSTQRGQR